MKGWRIQPECRGGYDILQGGDNKTFAREACRFPPPS